jgi:hypothetical protein
MLGPFEAAVLWGLILTNSKHNEVIIIIMTTTDSGMYRNITLYCGLV